MTLHLNRNEMTEKYAFCNAESDTKQHLPVNDLCTRKLDKHVKLAVLIVMNITVSYMYANLQNCVVLGK